MRTVFLGTPALAVPFLEQVARQTDLAAVITAPDQPAGRGYALQPPAVKQAALELSKPVWQPASLREPSFLNEFSALAPDVGIVVAYGKLLPSAVLAIPKFGFLNAHFSLLPAFRGAAPIQWALINGEKTTGVTLFWLDEGMDTGPIFLQKSLAVDDEDDAESLRAKLVTLGVSALGEGLTRLEREGKTAAPQKGEHSHAPPLAKEDGRIRWSEPALRIRNLVRGTVPWPGAFTLMKAAGREQRLKILEAEAFADVAPAAAPGAVVRLEAGKGPVIKCGSGFLIARRVQPEGKKPMSGWEFWQGARLKIGDSFN